MPLASLELLLSKSGQVQPKSILLGECNCPAAVNKKTAIETVGFVRLKQLTLGYNVPQSIMKKIGLESGRVFFTGENLFLITNYSGVDPESVDPTSGIDNFNNYPLARKLTLGLTLKF